MSSKTRCFYQRSALPILASETKATTLVIPSISKARTSLSPTTRRYLTAFPPHRDPRTSIRRHPYTTTPRTTMPFTLLNNHTLHYTDLPPSTNTNDAPAKLTLIFVHGLGSSQNYYYPILPALTARGFRCVVFDNYLAGRSFREEEWRAEEEASVQGIAADVLGLLDRLRVERAVVVGYR